MLLDFFLPLRWRIYEFSKPESVFLSRESRETFIISKLLVTTLIILTIQTKALLNFIAEWLQWIYTDDSRHLSEACVSCWMLPMNETIFHNVSSVGTGWSNMSFVFSTFYLIFWESSKQVLMQNSVLYFLDPFR